MLIKGAMTVMRSNAMDRAKVIAIFMLLVVTLIRTPASIRALVPLPQINITATAGATNLGQLDLNGSINETQNANATSLPPFGSVNETLDRTPLPISVADPKLPEGESVTPLNTTFFG